MAFQLVALGGEAPLELSDHTVDGGQVLDRAGGEGAVELVQRALGGEAGGALDQVALEFAPEVLLELSELISRQAFVPGIVFGQVGLGLGSQAEGSSYALHVDAEDAGALAAAERGDREPGQISQRVVRPVPERCGDLLAERVEVDVGLLIAALSAGASVMCLASRLGLGGAEEEPVEHELEDSAVVV